MGSVTSRFNIVQFTNILGRLANVSVVLPMCLVVWPTYSVVLPTYSVRFANVFGQLTIAVGSLSQEKKYGLVLHSSIVQICLCFVLIVRRRTLESD